MQHTDYPVRSLDRRVSDLSRRVRGLEKADAERQRKLDEVLAENARLRRESRGPYYGERPAI